MQVFLSAETLVTTPLTAAILLLALLVMMAVSLFRLIHSLWFREVDLLQFSALFWMNAMEQDFALDQVSNFSAFKSLDRILSAVKQSILAKI